MQYIKWQVNIKHLSELTIFSSLAGLQNKLLEKSSLDWPLVVLHLHFVIQIMKMRGMQIPNSSFRIDYQTELRKKPNVKPNTQKNFFDRPQFLQVLMQNKSPL